MAPRLAPIGHDDRLSIVEHLDELRSRLFVVITAFVIAFSLCLWQDDGLLDIINQPLEKTTQTAGNENSAGALEGFSSQQVKLKRALTRYSIAVDRLAAEADVSAATRRELRTATTVLQAALAELPSTVPNRRPVTLGVSEPFTTTLTVAGWGALLLCLPILLFQLYAFVLPAFSPGERRAVLPLMAMVPFLFITGVVFCYFVILPPAVKFLQNFNDDSFDILVQARDYYRFAIFALVAMGMLFQMPVGILALTRVGILTPTSLRRNRRVAIVAIAVVAMLLPGTDPVTMLLAMGPLLLLYELSILLATFVDRRTPEGPSRWDFDDEDTAVTKPADTDTDTS